MEKGEWKKIIKKAGPLRLGIVVLCGVLLVLAGDLFSAKNKNRSEEMTESPLAGNEGTSDTMTKDYCESIKEELVDVLEGVEGVGEVQVMVTVSASGEKVTLKDNKSHENTAEEETVLIEDGERGNVPYVVQEREPELEGVVVVCEGGDDASVKKEITEAVSALFAIETHKIKIMKSKEAKE